MRTTMLALAATLLLASACGDDGSGDGGHASAPVAAYPEDSKANFMDGCLRNGREEFCRCVLDLLMETVPFEDFSAYEAALREDPGAEPPAEVMDVVTSCS